MTLTEYLNTSFRPDCDYLEGEVLERNIGEFQHSRFLGLLGACLCRREKELGILVAMQVRVQVKARRFRVPDITVLRGRPVGQIVTEPPLLCIEILSPSDRVTEMQMRIDDYLDFGVRYVWLINPQTRQTFVYRADGVHEAKDGVLVTTDPGIRLALSELE